MRGRQTWTAGRGGRQLLGQLPDKGGQRWLAHCPPLPHLFRPKPPLRLKPRPPPCNHEARGFRTNADARTEWGWKRQKGPGVVAPSGGRNDTPCSAFLPISSQRLIFHLFKAGRQSGVLFLAAKVSRCPASEPPGKLGTRTPGLAPETPPSSASSRGAQGVW